MFVSITNTPRDYAWGSTTAMAALLGTAPSGLPEAELWFGAHRGSPSRIVNPALVSGARDLAQLIERDPEATVGQRGHLPFLMKVLAAEHPLSLQAHPSAAQAREGFERENAMGIPLDAPHRNYRDEFSKPEIIVTVSDRFEALCGFRPKDEAAKVLSALGLTQLVGRLEDLPALFEWLMRGGILVEELLQRLDARVASFEQSMAVSVSSAADARSEAVTDVVADALDTVRRLSVSSPHDPGIICALLLNRVTLRKGEALFLPAGNIHAYLEGVGIEVMSASDNVLRGGLTAKHVDLPELVRVLDFTPAQPPRLLAEHTAPGVAMYSPDVDDFALAHVTGDADILLTGPSIALCLSGAVELTGQNSLCQLSRGEAVFISPDERSVSVRGGGEIFFATTP